ncbi:RNA polymerase sigma factor [Cellulomonas endophytica]|uniref:RNA polymerase sigma factor n=1 Tax=Cellulomonas endophytica TaxID=2494735 RepID=UPI001013049B|nr:sigma-70 family RNA polymerase sigma factor [Cellulomonas endophytica]
MRSPDAGAEAWFDGLWRAHAPRVQAYALRHVGPRDAEDVLAETFTVAWRRRQDVPADALPWLLVVARNTIANTRRSELRHDERVAALSRVAAAPDDLEGDVAERAVMLDALARLPAADRQALLLTAWDGLAPAAAAAVAGCSTTAFSVRVHRARGRLTRLLRAAEAAEPGGATDRTTLRTTRGR